MGCSNCVESENVQKRSTLEEKVASAPSIDVDERDSRKSSSSNRKHHQKRSASMTQATSAGMPPPNSSYAGELSALTQDILRMHDEANAKKYNKSSTVDVMNNNRNSNNSGHHMETSFNTNTAGGGEQHNNPPTTGASLGDDSHNSRSGAGDDDDGRSGLAAEGETIEKEKRRQKKQEQDELNWKWVSSISEPDILQSGDGSKKGNSILAAMRGKAKPSSGDAGQGTTPQGSRSSRRRSESTATTDFFDQVHAANRKSDPSGRLNKIYGAAATGGMEASMRTNDSQAVQLPRKNNTTALEPKFFKSDSQPDIEGGGSSEVSSSNHIINQVEGGAGGVGGDSSTPLEIDFDIDVGAGGASATGGAILWSSPTSADTANQAVLPMPTSNPTPPMTTDNHSSNGNTNNKENTSTSTPREEFSTQKPEDIFTMMNDTCNNVTEQLSSGELKKIAEVEDIWDDDGGRAAKEPEDPCFWKEKVRKLQIARQKKRQELLAEQAKRKDGQMKRMEQLRAGASGRPRASTVMQSGGARSATVQSSKPTTGSSSRGGGQQQQRKTTDALRRSSLQNPSKSTGALNGY